MYKRKGNYSCASQNYKEFMFLIENRKLSFAYQPAGAAQDTIHMAQAQPELGSVAVQGYHHLHVT